MVSNAVGYPAWTEYRKKNGLDPLGMQNASINLYQRLLPGVSNVALRMRYYGFYPWLATRYAQTEGSTDAKLWQRTLRRAEALYALTCSIQDDVSGIAGILWANRHLGELEGDEIDFASHADPDAEGTRYLKQAWGAYGAAYGSQLFETGILADAAEHSIPVPSSGFGDALAEAVSQSFGSAGDRFYAAVQRGHVSREELLSFDAIIPSNIATDSNERQLYENLLFATGPDRQLDDIARRETLQLVLRSASHLKSTPDAFSFRWLLYSGQDQEGSPFSVDGPLAQQWARWRVYQANDLLHYGYETLLAFALSVLEAYPGGISMKGLLNECLSRLIETQQSLPDTWRSFTAANQPAANPWDADNKIAEYFLSEAAAPDWQQEHPITANSAWAALQLIAVVVARSHMHAEVIDTELGALNTEGFHSLVTETKFLRDLEPLAFTTAVGKLLQERVINRHLWVAHRKFRHQGDYTFLFEVDEGRLRQRGMSGPVFTSPRLSPAISFLYDIHLIGDDGLTDLGRRREAAT